MRGSGRGDRSRPTARFEDAMNDGLGSDSVPWLARIDAVILAALLVDGRTDARGLSALVDVLDRSPLQFDEVRYGIPRLEAAGLVVTVRSERRELEFEATPKARTLAASLSTVHVRDLPDALSRALGIGLFATARPPVLAPLRGLDPGAFTTGSAEPAWWARLGPDAKARTAAEVERIAAAGGEPVTPATRATRHRGRRPQDPG